MNREEARSLILSDLLKIENYLTKVRGSGKMQTESPYINLQFEDLQRLYDISINILIDYETFNRPYPSIIESLKFSNKKIDACICNHKDEMDKNLKQSYIVKFVDNSLKQSYFFSDEEDKFCSTCQQSPCECSDREKTSTVYDF